MADDARGGDRDAGRRITRGDLQLVIRRAAELYTSDADADERLSEAEVLQIADELGLPGRHVRQALYELPRADAEDSAVDRWFAPQSIVSTRVVPGRPDQVVDRLEDYLVTREFLQVVRRQGEKAVFSPADDAISNVARAVRRPQQWQMARAGRVFLEARPIPEGESHVRIELDVSKRRRRALTGGVVGGVAFGVPLAAAAFFPVGAFAGDLAGGVAGSIAGLAAGGATFTGTVAAGVAVARSRFRAGLADARMEMASLLDRLQGGRKLDPPPAPWLRSLRSRIADTLRSFDD